MADTQTTIRDITYRKFRTHLNATAWVHSSANRVSQASRSGLRSSLFAFQHTFHTFLHKQEVQIAQRKIEWDAARERGLAFGALMNDVEELNKRVRAIEV
jgi:hypothetical protein